MFIQRKKNIMASEEVMDEVNNVADAAIDDVEETGAEGEVIIDPEATDLLFEAEDVAELIAEVTGEAVEVTVEDDSVEFAIGDEVFTVEAEGNEEILEAASKKVLRGKRTVAASTRRVGGTAMRQRRDKAVRTLNRR